MRPVRRTYKSANEALAQIALELVIDGEDISVCNAVGDTVLTKDIFDYDVCFAPNYNNVITLPERKFPKKGAKAEFLWYMTGNASAELVAKYLPNWRNYANEQGFVNSNYGVYWHKYLPRVIDLLKNDKHSRQAVLNIYHAGDAPFGKDTPCTLTIQFVIRNNALHMIVMMRSNDVWYGFSIDQFCNSLLHQLVWHELLETYPDLELGQYVHHAGSMHAYISESKGNAKLTTQMLGSVYNSFANSQDNGERIELPTEVTFSNFWDRLTNLTGIFDEDMLEHFQRHM